jgi:ABC-type phosphate transport system substrate-binding protein
MPSTARRHGRHRREAIAVLVALAASAASITVALAEANDGFRVVTHPSNHSASVERAFLADAFLKKTTRWPGDEAIYPVDQGPEASVRQRFSEQVLRRSVFAVRSYWQQRIFAGRGLPPPELESDEAVLRYVRSRPGAIGYVSERADVASVKVLSVR